MDKLPTTKKELEQMIQQGIETYMRNKQFNLSKIPTHQHNGTDTNKIPISSIIESIAITGTGNGVFSETSLDTQKVNNQWTTDIRNPPTVYTLPINIIYGYGVGQHSAFNAGDAEPGTMVFFDNAGVSYLCIRTFNAWYQIQVDTVLPV